MKPVYLDTNIVLDLLDSQRPGHQVSRKLIEALLRAGAKIVISEDMLTTIYYIAKNKERVLAFFQVILKEWRVEPFGLDSVEEATRRCQEEPGLDFEDLLQCLCAQKSGCAFLVTNDQSFCDCGFPVMDGEAALTLVAGMA